MPRCTIPNAIERNYDKDYLSTKLTIFSSCLKVFIL